MVELLLLAACAPAPTLAEVQDAVFTPSCAFSTCHGDGGGAAGLSLVDGVAYAELVDVPAEGAEGAVRVVPGDADGSYLVAKLEGAEAIAGEPMPATGGPLDDERLALVRAWIDGGAAE